MLPAFINKLLVLISMLLVFHCFSHMNCRGWSALGLAVSALTSDWPHKLNADPTGLRNPSSPPLSSHSFFLDRVSLYSTGWP